MKKKILVICQHYWPENFRISDMCEGFVENELEVDVLCGLPNYPKGELFDGYTYIKPRKQIHNGVTIYRCGEITRKGNTNIRIFLNYISFPFTATLNLFRLFGKKYDAVYCYQLSPVLMAFPAIVYAKLHKLPLIINVLDLWPENLYSVLNIKNKFLRSICKTVSLWHYNCADKLIVMSKGLKVSLLSSTKKSKNDIYIIPQYCESLYEQIIEDTDLKQRFKGTFNVVFAGNFSPAQGLDVLIEVGIKLKKDGIKDIHFIMVGDGMSHKDFVKKTKDTAVDNYFTFEGQKPVTDIPKYQTLADVLFASLAKSDFIGLTIPAKVTSYIAAGKPILLCMDGEGPKLIEEIGCGFSAESENADELYGKLLHLYKMDKKNLLNMGKKAKEYHKNYLCREISLKKVLDVLF